MISLKKIYPVLKKILSAKDMLAKIICVLFAMLLWAYINSTKTGDLEVRIPVNTINLSENAIISKISSKYINITLKGRKDILKNLNAKSIKATVDLEQPQIGDFIKYPIEISREEIPETIEIALSEDSVKILVEQKIVKKVKIVAKITDKVSEGFILGRIKVNPEFVTISGPESLVDPVDLVDTNNISVSSLKARTVRDISLNRAKLAGIKTDITRVKVIIPVIDTTKLFKFSKPVTLRNKNNKYDYIINDNDISVYLRSDDPAVIPAEDDFELSVNVRLNIDEIINFSEEEFLEKQFSVQIIVKRENIKAVFITPETITVRILEKNPGT